MTKKIMYLHMIHPNLMHHVGLLLCAIFGAVVCINELHLRPENVNVIEYGSVNLTCFSTDPLVMVNFQNAKGLEQSIIRMTDCKVERQDATEFTCVNDTTLIITLPNVRRSKHMDSYTCKRLVTTNSSMESNKATIFVKIPVKDVVLQNTSDSSVATIEELRTVFVCITENVYPEPEIIWFTNSTILQNVTKKVSIIQEETTPTYPQSYRSILTMFPKRSDNSTMIYCKAKNYQTWRHSLSAQMLVYFPPNTPSITMNYLPIHGRISIISGSSLTLRCSSKSYPAPLYNWSKEHTVYADRDTLNISMVSHTDHDGIYTCIVTNTMSLFSGIQDGRNNSTVTVDVLYPPELPYYLFNYTMQQQIPNNTLYAMRGDTMPIRCEAKSNPGSTYTWSGYEHYPGISTGSVASDIIISSISMDMNLTCSATNEMHDTNGGVINGYSTSSVAVIVLYPPERMQILVNGEALSSSTAEVVEGANVTIVGSATSVPPPLHFTLTQTKDYETTTDSAEGDFQITNVTRYNAGSYKLTAFNLMAPSFRNPINGTDGSSIRRFAANNFSERIEVNEHDSVILTCKVDGNPYPDVAILFGSRVLNKKANALVLHHMVNRITCFQMGTYECHSTNEYNKIISTDSLQITVTCSPRPKQNATLRTIFTSAMFVEKTIDFEIYALPVPEVDDFIWQRFDQVTSSWINLQHDNSTILLSSGLQTTISITNITQQSFGHYRFNVSNDFGTYKHEFELSPQDKPQPPTEFRNVDGLTMEMSICVSWKPGFDGGLTQVFFIDYRKLDSSDYAWSTVAILDNDGLLMNATLTFLASDCVYEFKLMSSNDLGNSTTVGPLFVKTKATVNSFNGKLFTIAIVCAAVGFSIITVVVSGILVHRTRKSKKKTNASKESTTSTSMTSRHVSSNSATTQSSLESAADTGLYENVLFSTKASTYTSESNLLASRKLSKKVKGTQPKATSQFFKMKKSNKGRKRSSSRATYYENSPVERFEIDTHEQRRYSEHDAVYQNESVPQTRVQVSSLFGYVNSSEFALLAKGLQFPCTVARKPENLALNRYNAIFAYDHSRVVLLNDPTFYMNACYIDGYRKRKAYIASLGPTEETTNKFQTFWKMVWYENSDIIVMLTNLVEISGMKCEQYWPEVGGREKYGDVKVHCRSEEVFAEYTVRTFDISKNKVVRPLHQLHFTAWPDKSVPDDVSSLLEFRQRLQATCTTEHGPIVVHCSAGVGRTGTFIALNNLIGEGRREEHVNVLACVKRLREQRVYMVQTEKQYGFIYKSLVHALEYETDIITKEGFQTYLESKDDAFYDGMFERLKINMESKPDVDEQLVNQSRAMLNRSGADIPGEMYRVRLYLDKEADDSDYINAVYLNSFKKKRYFIAAQTPTHVTVEDFVCMLYQESCVCHVSLGESETHGNVYKNEHVGLYLPPDNQTLTVGNFTVSCTKLETNPHYIVRRMTIKHHSKIYKEEKTSYHFQYTEWNVDKVCPNDPSEFANFITDIEQFVTSLGDYSGHVLVHCLDASERCGMFCAIATMIEKVISENQVNVGNTIRQTRNRRTTAIQNMKQLQFCHQAVNAYVNMYR